MENNQAFDAHMDYLCDQDEQQMSQRRTSSLVTAARGILERGRDFEHSTSEARLDAFRSVTDELTRRGIDASALIRYGMWREIAARLVGGLLVAYVLPPETGQSSIEIRSFDTTRWAELLGLTAESRLRQPIDNHATIERFVEILTPIIPPILSWIASAPLADLIELIAPQEITEHYNSSADQELKAQYGWAVDHFSRTYYSDWMTPSLHYAYRWISGDETPPCPPDLMGDRKLDLALLNAEIAKRAASTSPALNMEGHFELSVGPSALQDQRAKGEAVGFLLPEMKRYAKRLLRQGRYNEAAAVFEFGTQGMPDDAECYNNWGFCLVPVAASAALKHFDRARQMGYQPIAINVHNQMCCYLELGRARAALEFAESNWKQVSSISPPNATIWVKGAEDSNRWTLTDTEDVRRSIAGLAASVASAEDLIDLERLWRDRAAAF